MKRGTLFILALAVLGGAGLAHATYANNPVDGTDLVRLQASGLDEFYVRPGTDLAGYRSVIVDPAQVEFRKGWLKSINATRGVSRWLVPEDARNITDDAATSLNGIVVEAFRSRGYAIATSPDTGVLRVSPRVTDLFVNAPDVASAYPQALFNVDAGEATLILEVRDAATGTLLARVVDRGTAHELSSRINRALGVTNRFWFDAMFTRWAANCIREFETARPAR
jgi:Protein of unknown function (DUF3313)